MLSYLKFLSSIGYEDVEPDSHPRYIYRWQSVISGKKTRSVSGLSLLFCW